MSEDLLNVMADSKSNNSNFEPYQNNNTSKSVDCNIPKVSHQTTVSKPPTVLKQAATFIEEPSSVRSNDNSLSRQRQVESDEKTTAVPPVSETLTSTRETQRDNQQGNRQHRTVVCINKNEGTTTVSTEPKQTDTDDKISKSKRLTRLKKEMSSIYSPEEVEGEVVDVELRRHSSSRNRGELRHAMSEILPNEAAQNRKRSQTMANVKEHAYSRLQEELSKAQEELKLKDEECEKLLKVRDQMGEELEDLTASLFEEANNMVQEANIKRMHSEKLMKESNQQVEVLEAEVVALKQLVLTSTPSSPNKHLHPQIADTLKVENGKKEKPKSIKPFWKTHRRSTSHHEFTKEARQEIEAQQEAKSDRCNEIDSVFYDEFVEWRQNPTFDKSTGFLDRIYVEDIGPCLNFNNVALAERVRVCVEGNTLTIEPISGDSSYPRKCHLTETNKLCNYKIKLGEDTEWHSISQLCRNRIAAVCDFYTYLRYIQQGLVKSENREVAFEIIRLRKKMALARLGYT